MKKTIPSCTSPATGLPKCPTGIQGLDEVTGGVLTGTARVAQAARQDAEALTNQQEAVRRKRELERKRVALEQQIAGLRFDYETEEVEQQRMDEQAGARTRVRTDALAEMAHLRQADAPGASNARCYSKPKYGQMKTTITKRRGSRPDGLPANLWQLRLYVAGQTPKSLTAFSNLKRLCESHLKGRYDIEVIDLLKQPQLSKGDQILAIPTLVRKLRQPMRRIIDDLSDTERVLVGLDLRAAN